MEATLAERGQVVIPKAIRDQLGLTPGVLLTFTVEGGKLVIRKKVDDAFSRARGILKPEPGETVESIMRELRGRAPNDPIEPWEELRDDMYIAPEIRADHARRKAAWNANQAKRKTNNASAASKVVKSSALRTRK
jgi:antitoxin PrlF